MSPLPLGKAVVLLRGSGIAILAFGSPVTDCLEIAARLDATLVNMRFVKPLDRELVLSLAANHSLLVTVEENVVGGGAGSGVNETLAAAGIACAVLNIGLPDRFVEHGSRESCLADARLDAAGISRQIMQRLHEMDMPNVGESRAC